LELAAQSICDRARPTRVRADAGHVLREAGTNIDRAAADAGDRLTFCPVGFVGAMRHWWA
jgi:hypothetical protein